MFVGNGLTRESADLILRLGLPLDQRYDCGGDLEAVFTLTGFYRVKLWMIFYYSLSLLFRSAYMTSSKHDDW